MKRSTFGVWSVLAALVVAFVFASSARAEDAKKKVFAADKGPATVDVSTFPKEMQENYKIFAARCSKCHTLARPINTDMTASGWKMYVKRMMNKPDSGISPANAKRIYKFLKFYQKKKDAAKAKNGDGASKPASDAPPKK